MDYFGKGEVLTNTDLDRFVNNIWKKYAFCVHRKSLRSLNLAHEKWGQKQKCCVYNFVQLYIYIYIYIIIAGKKCVYINIWLPTFTFEELNKTLNKLLYKQNFTFYGSLYVFIH